MRCIEILSESGVDTAAVDRTARAALIEHLPEVTRAVRAVAAPHVGAVIDGEWEHNHSYYDRLERWVWANREEVATSFCAAISTILTDVARTIVRDRNIGNAADRNCRVSVEASEYSKDPRASIDNGYHNGRTGIVKVFVDGGRSIAAAMGIIRDDLFGEDTEGDITAMLHLIVPVFVHEYVHYEQRLRRGVVRTNDLGHITLGSKRERVNGKRRGKRGGIHRYTDTTEKYLRYIGSTHEIDAWASSAAAELVQTIYQSFASGKKDFNNRLQELRKDVAAGWVDETSYPSFGVYYKYFHRSPDQAIPGLDRAQMTKVWQRFLRSLYDKLGHYLHARVGKVVPEVIAHLDPTWVAYAQKWPQAQMIGFLAREVGKRVAAASQHESLERIKRDISNGYGGGYEGAQYKGEEFIRQYYFGNDYFSDLYERFIEVFRKLLLRTVMEYADQRETDNAL